MLKIFDPNILPTAISGCPLLAALTETASSGRLVPNATIVIAIISFPIPSKFEICTIESIVDFALMNKKIIEIAKER